MDKYFTKQRLSSYKDIEEYIENIILCQRSYPLLNMFEIVLRNRINEFFIKNFGTSWLKKILHNSFAFQVGREIENKVKKAEVMLIREKKSITHDGLLSNLTLGFWVSLLSAQPDQFFMNMMRHDKKAKTKYNHEFIRTVFVVNAEEAGKLNTVKTIQTELEKIKQFRNRVFHYERVVHTHNEIDTLIKKYIVKFQAHGTTELEDFINKIYA